MLVRPFLVLLACLSLACAATPALAGQVQLAWDAPDTSNPPASYLLYYWQEPAGRPQCLDVGPQTTSTLAGLIDGATYSFVVTDYDAEGHESAESNVLTVTMPAGPALVSPSPAAMLPDPTVLFAWTDGGAAVAEWWVYIGTSVGANDLLDSGSLGSGLSVTVDGLPTDGEALFVRLWYLIDDTWQFTDSQYAAALTP